jgi:hypothetical protein
MLMDNFCGHHASLLVRRCAFDLAGIFDESLMSYEDWDMSLRLAFHIDFLFFPGAVDVYNQSPHGLWLSRSSSGAGADDAARVIEKALRLLPESPENAEIKRKARVRLALGTSLRIADPNEAWKRVLATLREHPGVVDDASAQAVAIAALSKLIFQPSLSPLAVCKICSQFKTETRNSSEMARAWVRQTIVRLLGRVVVHRILGRRADDLR